MAMEFHKGKKEEGKFSYQISREETRGKRVGKEIQNPCNHSSLGLLETLPVMALERLCGMWKALPGTMLKEPHMGKCSWRHRSRVICWGGWWVGSRVWHAWWMSAILFICSKCLHRFRYKLSRMSMTLLKLSIVTAKHCKHPFKHPHFPSHPQRELQPRQTHYTQTFTGTLLKGGLEELVLPPSLISIYSLIQTFSQSQGNETSSHPQSKPHGHPQDTPL